ncbi:MAG: metallophosphoesterase family protein [Candidatus Anstonellales archaeon]
MKLLALADIHAEEQVIKRIGRWKAGKDYDYAVVCGDLTNNGPPDFAEEFFETAENCLFVPGNNDPPAILEIAKRHNALLHNKEMKIKGLSFVGFGYSSPTPYNTVGELSEEEIYRQMKNLPISEESILVLHSPPFGVLDEVDDIHAGSRSVRKIIDLRKPSLALFGHVHEIEGKKKVGETLCVNLPPAMKLRCAIIDVGSKIEVKFRKL